MSAVIPSFEDRAVAWSNPPLDDMGYFHAGELLRMPEERLRLLIDRAEQARYGGWRNYQNRWRMTLGLNRTRGKIVCDYGCGVGLEALQYAKAGNDVIVADISKENLNLALRVLRVYGYAASTFLITPEHLVSRLFGEFEIIHCAGVLHHVPEPRPVVQALAKQLVPDGELRLMLYSDEAWRIACACEPPARVEEHPCFERYWRHWDAVGGYADWYDADRLEQRFGEWFEIVDVRPLTRYGEYIGAVLRKR